MLGNTRHFLKSHWTKKTASEENPCQPSRIHLIGYLRLIRKCPQIDHTNPSRTYIPTESKWSQGTQASRYWSLIPWRFCKLQALVTTKRMLLEPSRNDGTLSEVWSVHRTNHSRFHVLASPSTKRGYKRIIRVRVFKNMFNNKTFPKWKRKLITP